MYRFVLLPKIDLMVRAQLAWVVGKSTPLVVGINYSTSREVDYSVVGIDYSSSREVNYSEVGKSTTPVLVDYYSVHWMINTHSSD